MKEDVLEFEAGSILVFSAGVYSDYGIDCHLITTKQVNLKELSEQYLLAVDKKDWWNRSHGFSAWLTIHGYTVPFDCQEVHLGDYNGFKISRY